MQTSFERVPDINDVRAAGERIATAIRTTPLLENVLLNQRVGRRILVKAECLQITGAFKLRGAWSALTSLTAEQRKHGVVAYSSGNHAQAVAYSASCLQIPAVIVMPADAPALKLANTRAYGAEVVLYDRAGGEDREAVGAAIAAERNLTLVKPYDNTQVIAGQGTCGLEIAAQATALGIDQADVLVCCGGGGLSSGIALALAADAPALRVWPVEPVHYDDVQRSLQSGKREYLKDNLPGSICDAIVTPSPGELTFPILSEHCTAGLTVTDLECQQAIAVASTYFKLVVEPGGAAALAAALFRADELPHTTSISTLSGGNVDAEMLAESLAVPIDWQAM